MQGWPAIVREALHRGALAAGMWEMRDQAVLRSVLEVFAKIGVRPIIFKGAALAYSFYPSPVLRTRADTDLLILPRDRVKVANAIGSLGFVGGQGVPGDIISYQRAYTLNVADGGVHSIDLHWKISNSELLSRLFSYEELLNRSTRLSQLYPDALCAGAVDALLLACMHRATHKRNPYYVDGLALLRRRSADMAVRYRPAGAVLDLRAVGESLFARRRKKDCARRRAKALQRAEQCFHVRCPEEVRNALSKTGEPVATYFDAGAMRQAWIDFLAIGGTADRLRFVRELFFPPAAYMRSKYPEAKPAWLPWLYARRAIGGLWNRLRHDRRAK